MVSSKPSKMQDKPGNCPSPDEPGRCVVSCKTDDNCKGILKCCNTACGGRTCEGNYMKYFICFLTNFSKIISINSSLIVF